MQTKNECCSTIDKSKLMLVHEDDIENGVFNCPDTVESIGEDAFASHKNLITVVNLNKVKHIEDGAFKGSSNLITVIAPEVETIGNEAFQYCKKLISIDLPKVTALGWCTFHNCTSLTTINAPQLQQIEANAFMQCEELVTLNLAKVESFNMATFFHCSQLNTLILHPKVQISNEVRTALSSSQCENLKQVIIDNLDNTSTSFDKKAFIAQLPLHLKHIEVVLASELLIKNLWHAKEILQQHGGIRDIEKHISSFSRQVLFFPQVEQKPTAPLDVPSATFNSSI